MADSIDQLFTRTMFYLNQMYSQHYEEKGDSWCIADVVDLRVRFFEEYHEFKDAINTPSKTEKQRFLELIDVILMGLMLAEQWLHESEIDFGKEQQ